MSNFTDGGDGDEYGDGGWASYDEGSLYRDVDWNSTEYKYPQDTPGCQLYNFIMYAVLGGSVCLLGCVGNVLAFVVFWRDKVKTSTSLLFQVRPLPFHCLSLV